MIIIKNVTLSELSEVLRVEGEAWPAEIRAEQNKFASRLKIFPSGFIAAYENDHMVGISTSQIINYPSNITSWEEVTDKGFITNHDPSGNTLYIVSLGVSKFKQRQGIGTKLISQQIKLARNLGLKTIVLGARIPEYYSYSNIPVNYYVGMTQTTGQPLDKEIRFYSRSGFKIERIVHDYMFNDPESLNYGIIMKLDL